jgi:hypothetical protein
MYEKIAKVLRPVLITYQDFVTLRFKIFKNNENYKYFLSSGITS